MKEAVTKEMILISGRRHIENRKNNIQRCQCEGLLTFPNLTEIQLILRHDDGQSTDASAFVRYQHPSLLGGLERGVSPAWWLYQLNQRDQALRAGEMAARYQKLKTHSVRRSVSPSHFRASHRRRYQHITTRTLKAFTALSKTLGQCVSYSYCAELNLPFLSRLE